MTAYAEVRPAPAAELRTSAGLVALAAALSHVMGASHAAGGAMLVYVAMALVQGAVAAGLGFSPARWVIGPAIAVNAMLALVWIVTRIGGLPISPWDLVATLTEVVAVGAALALALGAGDRALSIWSKVALAVFAVAAFSGFGHVGH
jgi:hypothetical protein